MGLVLVTVLCVGPGLHALIPHMPLVATLALVAVLSPTDAIAGTSLLKRAPLSRRAGRIIEGEALLNDASALICLHYVVVLGSTAAPSGPFILGEMIWIGAGGLAIGAGVGVMILMLKNAILARLGETTATQILISLLFPYAAYHAAVALGASGILAAVAAGVAMGRWELGGNALPVTRLRGRPSGRHWNSRSTGSFSSFWESNCPASSRRHSRASRLGGHLPALRLGLYIAAAATALTLVRLLWVGAMVAWHERQQRDAAGTKVRVLTALAMTFSGVRGAVTLAAALALPMTLPGGLPSPPAILSSPLPLVSS